MGINVLKSDEKGNVIAHPVIGWMVTTVKGETVIAAIEYTDSQSEPAAERRTIQLELSQQQCLWLAQALTGVVNHIAEQSAKRSDR